MLGSYPDDPLDEGEAQMELEEKLGDGASIGDDVAEWQVMRSQGVACAERGELAKALDWFLQALDLYRATGEPDELAGFHAQIGEVQMELGHLDEAISQFKQTLAISQEHHDGAGLAGAHRRLGMAFQEKGDFDRAEESYREADRALETQEDHAERGLLHLHWGSLLEDLARYKKARDEYKMALGVFQSLHDTTGEITARRRLASALQQLGASSEAEQELHFARALLERQGGTDKPELIEVLNLLGGVLEDQGRTGDALELFREAHSLADTLGIGPAKVECLRRMGSALAVRGELDEASDRYKQAVDICKQLDDRKALSEIYGDLGEVYIEQGNLKDAIKVFKEAERLDHDDPLGFALAKRRLGGAYQEKGDYQRAEEYYSEADSLLDNLDDDGERAVLYTAWGSLSQERGQVRDALARYKQALAINESQKNALGEAICRRHIGSALHDLGRLEDAAEELQRARALFEQQGDEDKPELIEVTNRLGAVFEDEGRIAESLDLFRQAHTLADRLGIGPAKVECLRRMGSALAACGSLMEAEGRYREAIELCGELRDEVALSALHGELGDVLAEQGRIGEAIKSYKEALALDQDHSDLPGLALANRRLGAAYQRTGDLDRARDLYDDAERLLQRLEDDDERALLYLQRGSLFEDQGKYTEALSEYGRARAKYEDQRNALGIAAARRSEASAYLQIGRLADAEVSAVEALDAVDKTEDKPELLACLNLVGAVRCAQGRLEPAQELHSRALAIAESLNLQPARASSLRHLGAVLAERAGDGPRLALERLETALAICEQLKDEVACAELQDDIADVHLARNEIADAVMHYERGLSIARRLDRSALTADILLGLARCSRQMGKLDGVRVHLHEARAMIDSIDRSRPRQARLWLELAQIDEAEGKEDSAIEGLEKALGAFRDCNDTAGAMECHQLLLAAYTQRQDFSHAGLHLSQGLELEGNVRALWAVMLNQLHPAIRDSAHGAFAEGRFGSGVLEALKCCEQELRARAAIDDKARMPDVIAKALSEERRGGIAPWPQNSHLSAFKDLCINAFLSCRNPLAHNQLPMNASQAFSWLGIAHLMMTLMDAPPSRDECGESQELTVESFERLDPVDG
jgi:tetratricopeptide (TPR) repeat protein